VRLLVKDEMLIPDGLPQHPLYGNYIAFLIMAHLKRPGWQEFGDLLLHELEK